MTTKQTQSENIGIILVHGIGEQKRFEHLSTETSQIVCSLQENPDVNQISVQPRTTQNSAYAAEHETWLAEDAAPVRIDITWTSGRKPTALFIHEVWWADLDDKVTLWNQVKFWFWALGQWGIERFTTSKLPGFQDMMLPLFAPGHEEIRKYGAGLRLWFYGLFFLMAMGSLALFNYLLSRLHAGRLPGVDIFYQYLGDVKLYQERLREGEGVLSDIGQPPRVAIRRRMVRVLVDAYRADYERWYVLAHSLGTVLAWNGLMETAHCLPNFLDEETWKAIVGTQLVDSPPMVGPVDKMRPPRPVWIQDDQAVILRDVLFSKLRGLVTYGSPLDKFAYLWGPIVAINKDRNVFRSDFEWVNVFAHNDPVGAKLIAYNHAIPVSEKYRYKAPRNFAYRASPVFLLSHICYLTFKKAKPDCFVNRLNEWMLNGEEPFRAPTSEDSSWDPNMNWWKGFAIRGAWWAGAVMVMAQIIAEFTVPGIQSLFEGIFGDAVECNPCAAISQADQMPITNSSVEWLWSQLMAFPHNVVSVFLVSAVIVTLTGLLRNLYERYLNKKLDP